MNKDWLRKMATNKVYTVKYRRKRELKTDYKKRLKLLASHRTRLAIRVFSRKITIQAIDFTEKGDKVSAYLDSTELRKYNWNAPHQISLLPI